MHAEAGRGWGKTRFGSETCRIWEKQGVKRIALVSRTIGDVRDTMIEGESGILAVYPDNEKPLYIASRREIRFKSGMQALIFSDEKPDSLRGPQFEKEWWDEPGAWPNLRRTYDNALFGLRLGKHPQIVATTTPKRRKAYRDIFHPKTKGPLRIVRRGGSSYDNLKNLSSFYRRVLESFKGSRLARQEIDGVFLQEIEGALWTETTLDAHRAAVVRLSDLVRIVVAIDPAVTSTERSNETGIVVCGLTALNHGYVLGDFSFRGQPEQWGSEAVRLYHLFKADAIIGEVNNGGDLVERNIKAVDSYVNYRKVSATRGKSVRAEPISTLYRRGQIHHASFIDFGDGIACATNLEDLEDQMTQWDPNHSREKGAELDDAGAAGAIIASPDRVDANVWGFTDLFGDDSVKWDSLARYE